MDFTKIPPLPTPSLSIPLSRAPGIELSMTLSADLPALDPLRTSLHSLQYYTTYPRSLMRFHFPVRNILFLKRKNTSFPEIHGRSYTIIL